MAKGLETPAGVEAVAVDEGGEVLVDGEPVAVEDGVSIVDGERVDAETGTPLAVMELRLQPLNDFVIIFPDTGKKYTGKIELLSENVAGIVKTKFRGLVVAAGPKCEAVKKGHYVYFWKHAGSIQYIENHEFRVCREAEVLAIDLRSPQEVAEGDKIGAGGDFAGQDRTLPDRAQNAAEQKFIEDGKKEQVVEDGWG